MWEKTSHFTHDVVDDIALDVFGALDCKALVLSSARFVHVGRTKHISRSCQVVPMTPWDVFSSGHHLAGPRNRGLRVVRRQHRELTATPAADVARVRATDAARVFWFCFLVGGSAHRSNPVEGWGEGGVQHLFHKRFLANPQGSLRHRWPLSTSKI